MTPLKKTIISIIIILSITSFFMFFVPAYESLKVDCFFEGDLSDLNIGGAVDVQTGEVFICVDENNSEYKRILKHENCHLKQFTDDKFYSCDFPVAVFFNEVECYFSELF